MKATVLGVTALVLSAWGASVPASAATYAPSIGTLTGTVASGPTSVAPQVVASAPCPGGTFGVSAYVDGNGLVKAVAIPNSPGLQNGIDSTGVQLGFNLLDVAASQGKTLINGAYDVAVVCQGIGGLTNLGQFDGQFTVTGGATATAQGTTYTWKVAGPQATTTGLAVTPAGGAAQGASVTLTASVSPPGAAGSVQFVDLATGSAVNVGSAATVGGGTATLTTSGLSVGNHTLRADFTPTDAAAFGSSKSSTVAYAVSAKQPTTTTTGLAVTPTGGAAQGASVPLTATVSPSGAAGSVQFVDLATGSAVNVGSPTTVSGGIAASTTSGLATGSHTLRADFTPTDTAAFGASSSSTVGYQITAKQPTATTTTLVVTPAGTAVAGTSVQLSASVTPAAAAGSVQFVDLASGSPVSVGSPVTVSGGTATTSTTSLAQGNHSIEAVFTPTEATVYTTSTSAAVDYVITATQQPPTTTATAISASPASTAVAGDPVTLTATVSPAAAAGSVQFVDVASGSPANVGNAVAVANGKATVTVTSLAQGDHSLRADFTPTDAAAYSAASSSTLAYTITAPVQQPTATTTTLTAAPAGGSTQGNAVTFTANVSPAAAAGGVQFSDTVNGSSTPLGSPVQVSAGAATMTTSNLAAGTHQITASFTPTDAGAFSPSASSPLSYQVSSSTPNPTAKPTVTRLAVLPLPWWSGHDCSHDEYEGAGSQRSGPGALLVADVRSSRAAGSVQFFETVDGVQQPIGQPVTAHHGQTQLVARPLAAGRHTFTAVFIPADTNAYRTSTSNQASVTIPAPHPHGRRANW